MAFRLDQWGRRLTRSILVLGLVASLAIGARPASADLSPEVQAARAGLGSDVRLPVIVYLRAQDNAALALEPPIDRLQQLAEDTQRPVIDRLQRLVDQGHAGDLNPLWIVNAVALSADTTALDEIARWPEVGRLTVDRIYELAPPPDVPAPALDQPLEYPTIQPNLVAIGAPFMWTTGITGTGAVVASLDTGVDVTHPDLAPRWRGGAGGWFDPYGQCAQPCDPNGHGSRGMGIMVGGADSGSVIGVAPGARWIAARVFDTQGRASTSAIHQAFQWALDPDGDPNTNDAPDVVNASWDLVNPGACDLTFAPDLKALVDSGITPVFAAGNQGAAPGTAVSPANNPDALPVGAADNAGQVQSFSSRGPTQCGVGLTRIFPELVAPGVGIFTADRMIFGDSTPRYIAGPETTGTSFSAPHVSGALALLVSAFPGRVLSPVDLRVALAYSAHPLPEGDPSPNNEAGAGMLDVWAAYQALSAGTLPTATPTVTASPLPTLTPTAAATATPRPSATPSPMPFATNVGRTLYLAWVSRHAIP